MRREERKGFTLIELLIVVAIIAILALIAVPNFLEAQVRSKVSRVKADMRTLATALEAYRVDYNSVPCWDSWDGSNKIDQPGPFWIVMTTPISYITTVLRDPFVNANSIAEMPSSTSDLDVWIQVGVGSANTDETDGLPSDLWCAVSFGPDFSDDTDGLGPYPFTNNACPYDPTNGTVSRGDIDRHSGRPPTNFLSSFNLSVAPGGRSPWW